MLNNLSLASGLHVEVVPGKTLHRLMIYDGDVFIGEYERSIPENVPGKLSEIERASELLQRTFRQDGPFVVRWHRKLRRKEVRRGGSTNGGAVLTEIPMEYWR